MTNLIEYREGASFHVGFDGGQDWQDKVNVGRGWSYGAELFVQKKRGAITGWIGYTVSWTNRHFAELNQGRTFPYRYDRRHDLALVLIHQLSRRNSFSLTWVYGTGNAVTLPVALYYGYERFPEGREIRFPPYLPYDTVIYGDRNSYRMAPFHRLDFSFNSSWPGKSDRHGFSFGVYNAYNRKNPYFIYFDNLYNSVTRTRERRAKQVSLFPFLPWLNYRFKF